MEGESPPTPRVRKMLRIGTPKAMNIKDFRKSSSFTELYRQKIRTFSSFGGYYEQENQGSDHRAVQGNHSDHARGLHRMPTQSDTLASLTQPQRREAIL